MLTKDVIAFCNKQIKDTEDAIATLQEQHLQKAKEYDSKSWFVKFFTEEPYGDYEWDVYPLRRSLAFLNTTLKRAKYNQANDKNWMMVEDSAWFQREFYKEYTE